ncbi:MAG: cyclic pyranopterin monophosphate synthase MoaC [Pirellulaceae bacterium]
MTSQSSHFDTSGQARMVDITEKAVTARIATAEVSIKMQPATMLRIQEQGLSKGDVLGVARLAAIQGSKATASLIPLCHAIPIEGVDVQFEPINDRVLRCLVTVKTTARTGVEMEALTSCGIAALTVYDMCKSIDRSMEISDLRLVHKSGGRSGEYVRSEIDDPYTVRRPE